MFAFVNRFTWKDWLAAVVVVAFPLLFVCCFVAEATYHDNDDTWNSAHNEFTLNKCRDPHDHDISIQRCNLLHEWSQYNSKLWLCVILAFREMSSILHDWLFGWFECKTEVCRFIRDEFFHSVGTHSIYYMWACIGIVAIMVAKSDGTKLKEKTEEANVVGASEQEVSTQQHQLRNRNTKLIIRADGQNKLTAEHIQQIASKVTESLTRFPSVEKQPPHPLYHVPPPAYIERTRL